MVQPYLNRQQVFADMSFSGKKPNQLLPRELDGAVQIMLLITISSLVSIYVLSMLDGSGLCTLHCHHFCGHRADTSKLYLIHIAAELLKSSFLCNNSKDNKYLLD